MSVFLLVSKLNLPSTYKTVFDFLSHLSRSAGINESENASMKQILIKSLAHFYMCYKNEFVEVQQIQASRVSKKKNTFAL